MPPKLMTLMTKNRCTTDQRNVVSLVLGTSILWQISAKRKALTAAFEIDFASFSFTCFLTNAVSNLDVRQKRHQFRNGRRLCYYGSYVDWSTFEKLKQTRLSFESNCRRAYCFPGRVWRSVWRKSWELLSTWLIVAVVVTLAMIKAVVYSPPEKKMFSALCRNCSAFWLKHSQAGMPDWVGVIEIPSWTYYSAETI